MHDSTKPSILNQIALLIGLVLIIGMLIVPFHSTTDSPNRLAPTPYVFSQAKLWQIINNWQIKQGWEPYIENDYLCILAKERLEETRTDWSHKGFEKYIGTFKYTNLGENLVRDYATEEEAFRAWLTSPPHRKNLTDYYTYSCLRCEGNRCVQLFLNY